jgi:hypothetical protein
MGEGILNFYFNLERNIYRPSNEAKNQLVTVVHSEESTFFPHIQFSVEKT